jgi:hypothetical protein
MPKKHRQTNLYTKPPSTAPPALFGKSGLNHDSSASSATQPASSVNELISHLRQTQSDHDSAHQSQRTPQAASVPPAVRNILSIPEPMPPDPRQRPAGARRPLLGRRIPGPLPPRSWLVTSSHAPAQLKEDMATLRASIRSKQGVNLPGGYFPPERSLQHIILKSMASNLDWHIEYDSIYLTRLPVRLKQTLLSYIGIYGCTEAERSSENNLMRRARRLPVAEHTLQYLFGEDPELSTELDVQDESQEVTGLDLAGLLGYASSTKNLFKTLSKSERVSKSDAAQQKPDETPDSWDLAAVDQRLLLALTDSRLDKPIAGPRFMNLARLSLSLSGVADPLRLGPTWRDLLALAPHLSRLSFLSLAYWPTPTLTPHAAKTYSILKNPISASIPGVSYGGSNMYTSMDGEWAEAAGLLRRLSRELYCLQWLDLTGCGEWFNALLVDGSAEWNQAWRGVEYLGLEVGWVPVRPEEEMAPCPLPSIGEQATHDSEEAETHRDWDNRIERKRYYYRREAERYKEVYATAQSIAVHVRTMRKGKGGKWITVELGKSPESPVLLGA